MWLGRALVVTPALLLPSLGCATVFHGSNERVTFTSDQPETTVHVDGLKLGKTPLETELDSRKNHTIDFEKEGFEPRTLTIHSAAGAGWVTLDVIPGILAAFIPLIVDGTTGDWGMLDQKQVAAHLDPLPLSLGAAPQQHLAPGQKWPCVKELNQNRLLPITRPEASQYGETVCVSEIEAWWTVRGAPKPVRSRDYDGGSEGDWNYRREWDLDGDGIFECREDECITKRPHGPYANCVSRLVNGQWKDDPPDVIWCVDPALTSGAPQ